MSIHIGETGGFADDETGRQFAGPSRSLDVGTEDTMAAFRYFHDRSNIFGDNVQDPTLDAMTRGGIAESQDSLSIAVDLVNGFKGFVSGSDRDFTMYFVHDTSPAISRKKNPKERKAELTRIAAERASHAQLEAYFIAGLQAAGFPVNNEALRFETETAQIASKVVCSIGRASLILDVERPCPDIEQHRYTGVKTDGTVAF